LVLQARFVAEIAMNLLRYAGFGALVLCLGHGVAQAGDITGAGSTFVAPVLSKWSADYAAQRGEGLSYQRIGSGAGISSLRSGTVDFAATDAPLKPAELQRFGFVQFPLVVGGVVPIVSLDGVKAGDLRLTGAVLADIYLGKLAKWNDPRIAELNPGIRLPAAPIIVAHRVDASGTTFNLTNYLSQVSADWRAKVGEGLSVSWPVGVGGRGNDGVAAFVMQTGNSIGYVDFAYARSRTRPAGLPLPAPRRSRLPWPPRTGAAPRTSTPSLPTPTAKMPIPLQPLPLR
jgi:phosphate transport system substrate-binding protein